MKDLSIRLTFDKLSRGSGLIKHFSPNFQISFTVWCIRAQENLKMKLEGGTHIKFDVLKRILMINSDLRQVSGSEQSDLLSGFFLKNFVAQKKEDTKIND